MTRRAPRLAAALVAGFLVLLAGGCTSAVMRPAGDLEAEVRELRQRMIEMQRQAAINQLALDELRAQVASLEAALGVRRGGTGSSAAARPAAPSQPARQSATQPAQQPATPSASVPRSTATARPPASGERDRGLGGDDLESEDLDEPPLAVARQPAPVAAAPSAAPSAAPPAGAVPSAATPAAAGPAPIPPTGQALYDRGYTLYHQGRYVDAEASFQRFLQAHGDTDLGDNAQYWIGEARYARGDYRGALAAFQETAARYPQGNKVPDALLKAGQSLEQLGDPEGARAAYRAVVDRFASSAAAVAAEERLARLR